MYYVSYLLNKNTNFGYQELYIVDGQNETQIKEYQQLNNTNHWNPCIPMPFKYRMPITITFNSTNWRYWYPKKTCDYRNNSDFYSNTYLFDGGGLTVQNLYINDYEIDNHTNYPIMHQSPSTIVYLQI